MRFILSFAATSLTLIAQLSSVQAGTITNQIHSIAIKYPSSRTKNLTSVQQTNTKGDTQTLLDHFIYHDAKRYYITGIPFTIQCHHFNHDRAKTYNSGLQGIVCGKLVAIQNHFYLLSSYS